MNRTQLLATIGALSSLATSQADFLLLDDFESYTAGDLSPQSVNWSFDANFNDATVETDAGNNYLAQGAVNGNHTKFDNSTVLIADGSIGTYFFRAYMTGASHAATAISPLTALTAGNTWNDGKAIVRFGNNSGSSTTTFGYNLGAPGSYSSLTSSTNEGAWYKVWILIDNTENRSYEVHIQSDDDDDFADQTPLTPTGLAFRQGTTDGDLQSLFFRTAINPTVTQFDDLYIDSTAHNLADPLDAFVDTDMDNMDDNWEIDNFGDITFSDGTSDQEPDGLLDLAEYLENTNPKDADTDGDTLEDGAEVAGSSNAFDGARTDPNDADSDDDGANDFEENGSLNSEFANAPTNPNAADTDEDGMPDGYELANNTPGTALDPNDDGSIDLTQAPNGDRDLDSLFNLEEFDPTLGPNTSSVRTRADLADTDGDGYSDFAEDNAENWTNSTQTGTNPVLADTDADGLEDGDENPDLTFTPGAVPSNSDPNLRDTDLDGFIDSFETTAGTDPNDDGDMPEQPTGFTLLEDFEGSGMVVGSTYDGVNGWSVDQPEQAIVEEEPIEGGDQVGCLTRTGAGAFEPYKLLDMLGLQIQELNTGTLFFQVYAGTIDIDSSLGLSDVSSPTGFGDFEAQTVLARTGLLKVRNRDAFDDVGEYAAETWMNVWIVADNDRDTVDLYYESPLGETGQVMVADEAAFRNSTSEALGTLLQIVAGGSALNESIYVDNFYIDPAAENLTTPAAAKPVGPPPSDDLVVTRVARNESGDLEITFTPGGATGFILTSASPEELPTFTDQGNYTYDMVNTFTVPAAAIDANPSYFYRIEESP